MSVSVLKPGLLSTLQDGGRPGHAAIGVGRAGAMDVPAWRLANALVGNRGDEAAIECTLLGPTLRFECATWMALTGAPIQAHVGACELPPWTACQIPAGSVLQLGGMAAGCRSYLSVRGGFDVAPVLGSRSSDLHARLGHKAGRPLQTGDVLPIGRACAAGGSELVDAVRALSWRLDPQPWFDFAGEPVMLLRGRHWSQLDEVSQERLHGARFHVGKDSNRTASRLDGQTLHLRTPLELISEAALPGTVQLPPSGQPIVLMAEAPVTGGYPRIGQVAAVDLPRVAQRRPGDAVCFRHGTLNQAMARLAEREQALAALLKQIGQRRQHDEHTRA
ncbi:MAG: biotin-dependent carboxyltransferase [Rhodanobacter sp.]|nr:MAG: biotin-dependent carboxyltransferase [Rhodanobacter sp.]TAL95811.1 MAG: biotin-dependent carboxyltransferase [Rhodanobacter sp.]TAM42585.1 MAG: biotin-dependent carboxyltransferase [Rhodanobacter sp.]TAN26242.1 MAG: biotin-dependent carboxyltransferase [Rhodanobacter sp.]